MYNTWNNIYIRYILFIFNMPSEGDFSFKGDFLAKGDFSFKGDFLFTSPIDNYNQYIL